MKKEGWSPLLSLLRVSGHQNDMRVLLCQVQADGETQSRIASGHQGRLACAHDQQTWLKAQNVCMNRFGVHSTLTQPRQCQ